MMATGALIVYTTWARSTLTFHDYSKFRITASSDILSTLVSNWYLILQIRILVIRIQKSIAEFNLVQINLNMHSTRK